MTLVGAVGEWEVTLTNGNVMLLAADSYSVEDDHYVFQLLMEGRPPWLFTVCRIPVEVVATVYSDPTDYGLEQDEPEE